MLPLPTTVVDDHVGLSRCTATNELDKDDPLKFSLTTPGNIESALNRVWKHKPTSERIIQDIDMHYDELKKVVESGGALVPKDLRLRSGKRRVQSKAAIDRSAELHPDASKAKEAKQKRRVETCIVMPIAQ